MFPFTAMWMLVAEDPSAQNARQWVEVAALYRQLPDPPQSTSDAVARRQEASRAIQGIYAQLAARERELAILQGEFEEGAERSLQALAARSRATQGASREQGGQSAGGRTAGQAGPPPSGQGGTGATSRQAMPLPQQAAEALMAFSLQRIPEEERYEQVSQEIQTWVDQEKQARGCQDEACEKAVEQMGQDKRETALNVLLKSTAKAFRPMAQTMERAAEAEAKNIRMLAQKGKWVLGRVAESSRVAAERISQTGMVQSLVSNLRSTAGFLADFFTKALDLRELDASGFQEPESAGTQGSEEGP